MKKTGIVLALCVIFTQNIMADDDSKVELDSTTVVAVANKQARPIVDIVGSVSIVNAGDISATSSENIADVLRYQSNIAIEDGGTRFGTSGINIRGIGDNRVAIEVDGVKNAKQFSIGSYSNAQAQFPDTDLIKSIEVLNGPASTLYGSDAIGGMVSITTWNPDDLTRLNDGNRYSKIRLGYDGKTHGRIVSGLSAWDNENYGGIIGFTQRDGKGLIPHDSFHDKRDFSDWDQQTLYSKFVVNTSGTNTLKLGFSGSQKYIETQINSFIGQERFFRTTEILADDNYDNYKFVIDYDFSINNNLVDDGIVRAYFANTKVNQETNEKRSSRRGTPLLQFRRFQYEQQNSGLELNLNKRLSTSSAIHNIIYGVEFTKSDIEESRNGLETNLNTGIGVPSIIGEVFPRRDFPNSSINEIGIFILDEISLENTSWTLVPAIRFDYYDMSPSRDSLFDVNGTNVEITSINESDISPKLGVLYKINDNSNMFAQYVRGFRAPPFDDVNIGLFNPIFRVRAIANPDLKSETSNGFEIGYRYFGKTNNVNLSLFHTDYNDFIESKTVVGVDPDTGFVIFQSRNISEANIYGIEASHSWQINNNFLSYTTFAWTKGNNKITNQPLNSISPAKMVNNITWTSDNRLWNVNLYSTLVKSKTRVDETDDFFKPAGFGVFDLFVNYKLGDNQNIQLGVFNIGNKKYWDWQQVRNFIVNEPIIDALSKPSRSVSFSYTYTL